LDTPIGDASDGRLGDSIFDTGALDPLDMAIDAQLSVEVGEMLDELPPREQEVLRRRFGFMSDEQQTLETVAEALNLSRERVRQIEARALRKLRHAPDARRWRARDE
jgi:RNA polymerase primary sigma factor